MSEDRCEIVKLRPDGSEATRYEGVFLDAPAGWVAARAVWGYRRLDAGYLLFEPGDVLDEFFALERPYNAFALYRGGAELVGWYCNVTHPTMLHAGEICWHDLYIDLIVYPDGRLLVLDEDELDESGLEHSDPTLHGMILAARDELLALAAAGGYPFSAGGTVERRPQLRSVPDRS